MRDIIRAVQFLVDQRQQPQTKTSPFANQDYLSMVENLFPTLAEGVPVLLESPTFSAFIVKAIGREPEILPISTLQEAKSYLQGNESQFTSTHHGGSDRNPDDPSATLYALTHDRQHLFMNKSALDYFEELHARFLNEVRGDNEFRTVMTPF